MRERLARNLQGKSIVAIDGTTVGELADVTMDPDDGTLRNLVVNPPEQSTDGLASGGGDRPRIAVDRITTVSDQIVVEPE